LIFSTPFVAVTTIGAGSAPPPERFPPDVVEAAREKMVGHVIAAPANPMLRLQPVAIICINERKPGGRPIQLSWQLKVCGGTE
jgi:hypothetical protein